ncbi:MAG: VIT domain-containing protein [Planctomycetota bacterium]
MLRRAGMLSFLVIAMLPAVGWSQGLLVVEAEDQSVRLPRPIIIWPPHPPHPPHPVPVPRPRPEPEVTYQVKSVEVQGRLTGQVAQVEVAQTFENTGSRQLEAVFVFPLPYDGAVDRMTLMVDGKEYPAKLLDAKEARRIYENIVRKNRDPALLEWMGTGMFKTSVFPVPPGAKRTVSLRYSQLLRKQGGLVDFLFPLSTARYTSKPVDEINIRLAIESEEPIQNIYSPTHSIEKKRTDERHVTVSYTAKNEVPSSDFRLLYDTGKGTVSAQVVSYRPDSDEDGYFLLLATPEIKARSKKPQAKTVVFVIDRSGSMSGKKIEQVRAALSDVLNKLREGDLFNIVAYDSDVAVFRPELQRFNDESRKAALGFVEGLYAGGSTNIDAALRTALEQLHDDERPTYVIFLTDGLPTAGETNESKLVAIAREHNKVRARIFTFGVGYDVNSRLLDRIARENFGQSDYVRPDEDIEPRVATLYNRIEAPVLTNVEIEFALDTRPEEGKPVNRIYPQRSFDLFAGEQLVIVGRYKKSGDAKVIVSGEIGGKRQKFDFPARFVGTSAGETNAFVERLWAMRRIGEILDELDLKGKNQELVEELVGLSTKHGILTPYTSFMADDGVDIRDMASNAGRASERLSALHLAEGAAGVAQRSYKSSLQFGARASASGPAPAFDRFSADAANAAPATRAAGGGFGFAEEAKREAELAQQNVQNVGNRTFYRRDNQWVDSRVTKEQEQNARRVKQFSDDYFELARAHGRTLAQYLVFDEPVLLNIGNEAFLIEP